jgi:hypothetical protein
MNAFIQLTQINKYAEFHVFWNEFSAINEKNEFFETFFIDRTQKKNVL